MEHGLVKREEPILKGVLPALASALLPGLGQLVNGDGQKALVVFVVWALAGASVLSWIPIVGALATLIGAFTWIYGVADAYLTGRR